MKTSKKTGGSDPLQQLVTTAPELVRLAQVVCGLWLSREWRSDRERTRWMVAQVRRHADGDDRPVTDRDVDERLRFEEEQEAHDLQRFQTERAKFAEAMASMRFRVAGLVKREGVQIDGMQAASACEVLEQVVTMLGLVVDAGQVPDRECAAAYRGVWPELETLVTCEVGALVRQGTGPGSLVKPVSQAARPRSSEPDAATERAEDRRRGILQALPGPSHPPFKSTDRVAQRLTKQHVEFIPGRSLERDLKHLRDRGLIDAGNRRVEQ